jgi:signal transduction histidine kinase
MQGFATAMLEEQAERLDETGRDYAQRIDRAAANMDVLIHDILAYGRLNHQQFPRANLSLKEMLKNVISMFQPELEQRKAVLDFGQVDFQVYASSAILEQIFGNLLSNALKFVEKNVQPRIAITAEERGEYIRVSVRDNGIGIPPEYRKRIFRPFERLHTAEIYPGTGIGLAMVTKGVERLGGKLGIDSEPGRGSCFWVEIPKTRESTV